MNLDGLTKSLCRLTESWTLDEDIRKSEQHSCKEIGRQINALGGFSAMQAAYRDAKSRNKAASVVQLYWHGIGDWQM